jgi:tRNA-dihydrouridine synthase
MSGVSDIAMRSIARRWGSDLTFSEFISSDAIFYKVKSYLNTDPSSLDDDILRNCALDDNFWLDNKTFLLAKFIEEERPFIIQLFGNNPEHFGIATKILNAKFRPDGFDINFGCPARSVINNGSGSCLFLQPTLARQIIETVKEASGNMPLSLKLRGSYKHVSALEFLTGLGQAPFENVTVHMRSYEQVHHGPADWEIGKALKHYLAPKDISLIINGGLDSGLKAQEALDYTGADGIMVAQASLGNPFIFAEIKATLNQQPIPIISPQDRINTLLDHTKLMLEHKGSRGIIEMRKHLLWYFKGQPNTGELRNQLSQVENLPQLENVLSS